MVCISLLWVFSFVCILHTRTQKALPFSRIVQRLVAESAEIDDIICGFRSEMGKTIDGFCVKFHVFTGDLYLSLSPHFSLYPLVLFSYEFHVHLYVYIDICCVCVCGLH